ncbi:MAG: preprotein translocase subunit YajC [Rickettsiales bacterium]
MLISSAFAQDATGAAAMGGQNPGQGILMLLLIFCIFYFLLIRPQSQRAKTHRQMVKDLKRGDEVVTSGGIIGKISKVDSDDVISVEIAEGITVQVARFMIAEVKNKKDEPTAANDSVPSKKSAKAKKADAESKNIANDN